MRRIAAAGLFVPVALAVTIGAQTNAPASFADYGQWETLTSTGARGGFAPDGTALVYGVNRSNRNNELRVTRLADLRTTIAAFGSQPVYSADSKWLGYAIVQSEAEVKRLTVKK